MHSVVVGLGKTGASCMRYLAKRGIPVSATDTRRTPPGLAELGALAESLDLRLGGFDLSLLDGASQVLMSPGVSLEEPIARAARDRGIDVLGDVEQIYPQVIEDLPVADFAYLQSLYRRINQEGHNQLKVTCPECNKTFEVEAEPTGEP